MAIVASGSVVLYFFGLNGEAHGPYAGTGRNHTGEFWTRSINADTGVIQLRYVGAATDAKDS